jgi:hypothetical protein
MPTAHGHVWDNWYYSRGHQWLQKALAAHSSLLLSTPFTCRIKDLVWIQTDPVAASPKRKKETGLGDRARDYSVQSSSKSDRSEINKTKQTNKKILNIGFPKFN